MDYNSPSPGDRKPKPWGRIVLFLFAAALALKYLPVEWRDKLPPTVKMWREKAFPPKSDPPKSDFTAQRSKALKPTLKATATPTANSPSFSKPSVSQPSLPQKGVSPAPASEITPSNVPLKLPGRPEVVMVRDERIRQLEIKAAKYPVFALYRALAQHHLELGNMGEAAKVFRTQATLYRRKGLKDAALILEKRAAQNETSVRVFTAQTGNATPFTGAVLEPRQGCYLGAFIDRDDSLTTRFDGDNWQYHHLPSEFEKQVKRRHATIFTYVKWGNFPREWLRMCKREGVIPHLAWEPQNLNEVRDDTYLRSCAQFLRELDWPVFVRFAGEMNGDWTPYHGNPALYRQKFQLVHRVLHRYARKVATIWCVNAIPSDSIAAYYPGDAGCDWVGVNFYSTPFADNDRTRQAFKESPLTLLEPIYRRYSARKPIAICEYATSHQSAVDRVVRIPFAIEKMSLLYGALPLLYPRVKMINWFSTNNLIHARAGRQLNNYRLTQIPAIEEAYRQLTVSPHFITSYPTRPTNPPLSEVRELNASEGLRRGQRIWLWVGSGEARAAVFVQANGQVIYAGRRYGKHVLDLEKLRPGTSSLVILAYDGRGCCISRRAVRIDAV